MRFVIRKRCGQICLIDLTNPGIVLGRDRHVALGILAEQTYLNRDSDENEMKITSKHGLLSRFPCP